MKRMIMFVGLIILVLGLSGCGEKLIHDDFKVDMEQVLETLDKAYEENRELTQDEGSLLERFREKYIKGDFNTDSGVYEMSDIEKKLVRDISSLRIFTKHNEPLASEKTVYENVREGIEELISVKEVPIDIKGKYPTYEIQNETNEVFLEDTRKIVGKLFYLTYDHSDSISESLLDELEDYIEKYRGDGFEVGGVHYLHNDETDEIYLDLWSVFLDLEEGTLSGYNQERLIKLEEELN